MTHTYAEPQRGQEPTHTIEIFRGPALAEGEDLALAIGAGATLTPPIWAWLDDQGLGQDDPDVYALLVPTGEGLQNPATAVLPVVAAEIELSTSELAELVYGPMEERPGETSAENSARRRRRLSDAAKAARRLGVIPVPDRRSGGGQRLWSKAAVVAALAARPGRGNRSLR